MSDLSNDKNLTTLLEDIKSELLSYINKRFRLFKLDSFEKLSITAADLGYGLIVIICIVVALLFLLMSIAFLISERLESQAAGFGITAVISLLIFFVIVLCKNKIKYLIMNKAIRFFRKVDANDEK